MDVVLAVVRVVVVDDELDVVHVQATGRDVCRHKNCRASRSNQVEHVRNMKEPCRNINRLWFNCIFVTVSSENLDFDCLVSIFFNWENHCSSYMKNIIKKMSLKSYLNSPRTQSRSFCCLSPWIHIAGQPSLLIRRVNSSALRFVSTKMRILALVSEPISSSRRASFDSFSCSLQTSTI